MQSADILIIGAGIAGLSLAARLATSADVCVLEAEGMPGTHATGRSAAAFIPTYGPPVIQALTRASQGFFDTAHEGYCETPLLTARDTMVIGGPDDKEGICEALAAGMEVMDISEARDRLPGLNIDMWPQALINRHTSDIDVDALMGAHRKALKRHGAKIVTGAPLQSAERHGGVWQVTTPKGDFAAPVVVNAAGAWADDVAVKCGVAPLGITPKRRSAALIDVAARWGITCWPLTVNARETFYFRPMGGKLMVSPADETPVEPHDAFADDMEIARALDMFTRTFDFEIKHVETAWAGLRSFAADKAPVVGFDRDVSGFFWLAGQGGYGIQTSPAVAELADTLIRNNDIPAAFKAQGLRTQALNPSRLSP